MGMSVAFLFITDFLNIKKHMMLLQIICYEVLAFKVQLKNIIGCVVNIIQISQIPVAKAFIITSFFKCMNRA